MASKIISITEDVYDLLKSLKAPGESFSEELKRLAKTKGSIMEFAGAWSDMSKEEIENIKKEITLMRKGTRLKEIEGRS